MKCNRVNLTLTFSAALAGLALTVLTPTAYGHGNNPKNTSDTEPNTGSNPPQPPESGMFPNVDVSGVPVSPGALDAMLDPGVLIGIDFTVQDAFGNLSQVLSEPMMADNVINPATDLSPQITIDVFGGSGSGLISSPASNLIPAPGALALLGLAAAAVGRRRRRRRS